MNEDKIIQKLIEMDERIRKIDENMEKNMVTRSEFLTAHEETVTFLKKLDQERIFTPLHFFKNFLKSGAGNG